MEVNGDDSNSYPGGLLSPDGKHVWMGDHWQPVLGGFQTEHARSEAARIGTVARVGGVVVCTVGAALIVLIGSGATDTVKAIGGVLAAVPIALIDPVSRSLSERKVVLPSFSRMVHGRSDQPLYMGAFFYAAIMAVTAEIVSFFFGLFGVGAVGTIPSMLIAGIVAGGLMGRRKSSHRLIAIPLAAMGGALITTIVDFAYFTILDGGFDANVVVAFLLRTLCLIAGAFLLYAPLRWRARRRTAHAAAAASAVQLQGPPMPWTASERGDFIWDGGTWRPLSPDGWYFWDGWQWQVRPNAGGR
jgi:hypothetical protein